MELEEGVVRLEVDELTKYIEDTVTNMVEKQETVEKLEDYDRLVAEIKDMRKKIEGLEAAAKGNVKSMKTGSQMSYKSEGDPEVEDPETVEKTETEETVEKGKKTDKKPEKKYDDEGNEITEEADMNVKKMEKLEAEIAELKASPLYKAQQDEGTVEKTETTETPVGVLSGVIAAHYGGN